MSHGDIYIGGARSLKITDGTMIEQWLTDVLYFGMYKNSGYPHYDDGSFDITLSMHHARELTKDLRSHQQFEQSRFALNATKERRERWAALNADAAWLIEKIELCNRTGKPVRYVGFVGAEELEEDAA